MRIRMRRVRLVQLSVASSAAAAVAFALLPTASASAAGTSTQNTAPVAQSAGDRQAAANKALVLYVQDQLWNDGNYSVIDKYVSPDYPSTTRPWPTARTHCAISSPTFERRSRSCTSRR